MTSKRYLPGLLTVCVLLSACIAPETTDVDTTRANAEGAIVAASSSTQVTPSEEFADLFTEEAAEDEQETAGLTRVCGTTSAQRGEEVDRAGSTGVRLFDTAPGKIIPRDFYLTGFDDGCARRFTAALALLGSPAMHELMRYDPMLENMPWSDVDKAYERVKNRTCSVRRGEPCGDNRISRLSRSAAFVTLYDRFGNSSARTELLLWKGELLASDVVAD